MSDERDSGELRYGRGVFGMDVPAGSAGVHLVPVPFDATTSYRPGTARGPEAIRVASRQIDLHDREFGDPWVVGIAMLDPDPRLPAWNVEARAAVERIRAARWEGAEGDPADLARVNRIGAAVNEVVETAVSAALESGRLCGTVGGDHATAYGSIAAHARRYPGMGILHIDAHADLRADFEGFHWSHGAVMANVLDDLPQIERLVQVGLRDVCEEELDRIEASEGRVVAFHDADLARAKHDGEPFGRIVDRIVAALPHTVYISFDIDGLDPVLCPHTGTPVPGGLDYNEAAHLIGALARSGRRFVGFDLVEVAPGPDGDEWDGNVAMRLLYRMIGWACWQSDRRD